MQAQRRIYPHGYTIDDDRCYVVEPDEAALVQEIYTRYAGGESVAEMIRDFTRRGLKAKFGGEFSYNTLHNILGNRKYIGEYAYGDTLIPGGMPAIISTELFERAQQRVEQNRRAPGRGKGKADYLLTTKLHCGHCGVFMVGESGKSKTGRVHHYYKCISAKRGWGCKKKAVKKDWIEEVVIRETLDTVLVDSEIERIAGMAAEAMASGNSVLPLLRKEQEATRSGIENMLNVIQKGVVTSSTQRRLKELEAGRRSWRFPYCRRSFRGRSLRRSRSYSGSAAFKTWTGMILGSSGS